MREEYRIKHLQVVFDPLNKTKANARDITEACGVVPHWFATFAERHTTEPAPIPVKDWMEECYGFGELHPMTVNNEDIRSGNMLDFTIEEDGTHRYPGDPDLYPYMKLDADNGAQFLQWESGIVAFRDRKEDPWFLTRMD